MSFEKVEVLEWGRDYAGYPVLLLSLDGKEARIGYDIKRTLLRKRLVFLGPEWEEQVPTIVLGEDESAGIDRTELKGFTQDERVLKACAAFLIALDNDEFTPQKFLAGQQVK